MSSTQTCSTCIFYTPLTDATGNCKVLPPTVILDVPGPPPDILYEFPLVGPANEACGQWRSVPH